MYLLDVITLKRHGVVRYEQHGDLPNHQKNNMYTCTYRVKMFVVFTVRKPQNVSNDTLFRLTFAHECGILRRMIVPKLTEREEICIFYP